jgi:RNA polymerase sigma-70 factor (ECF subfamily)
VRANQITAAQEEFSELLHQHRKIVYKVANSYAQLPEDRDDLAQEIASQLWRSYPSFDRSRSFSTWMYRIALNVAISHLRGTSLRATHHTPLDERLHDTLADQNRNPEDDERVHALYAFINELDALHRALLLLYLDDHSYDEIAEIIGITRTNVATKLSRLKQRIRTEMEG